MLSSVFKKKVVMDQLQARLESSSKTAVKLPVSVTAMVMSQLFTLLLQ